MALALALVVLVLVGALGAAMCFVGIQEARMGESARHLQRSVGVVEEGISEVIRGWEPAVYNARQAFPFDSIPVPAGYSRVWAAAQHKTGAYGGYVYKLNGELYFIDLTARDSLRPGPHLPTGVRQRVGLLAHIRPVVSGIEAPLTVGTKSRLSGLVKVDGNDRAPPGWGSCGPPDTGKAGVRTRNGAPISTSGAAQVLGNPPMVVESMPNSAPVAALGELTYTQLSAWATHTLPGRTFSNDIGPALLEGRCDDAVATNWGDGRAPNQPCGTYFPVIHVAGDATLSDLQGQGILLVDGNLVIRGGLDWYGIVLVRGILTVAADASRDVAIWGAVLAEDSVVMEGTSGHSVVITYSKCAILKALETVAVVTTLPARGWIGLSDVP